eukprot:scaffold66811_cov30-Tisochrysis_lutea.AAC.2
MATTPVRSLYSMIPWLLLRSTMISRAHIAYCLPDAMRRLLGPWATTDAAVLISVRASANRSSARRARADGSRDDVG